MGLRRNLAAVSLGRSKKPQANYVPSNEEKMIVCAKDAKHFFSSLILDKKKLSF